jgi:chemotaxis protein methyltransferase CheR
MSETDFEFIRTLVYERSRIKLDHGRRGLVAVRLTNRLRATRIASVDDYCDLLRSPRQEKERSRLIDEMSTNHTCFFREGLHFEFVRSRIVPEMLKRSRQEGWKRFNAWSAACSSGEEAYSLAVTLADSMGSANWPWHVEAADISTQMLEVAQDGVYKSESVVEKAPAWAMPYFQRGTGAKKDTCSIKPAIRANVSFRHLNLMDGSPSFTEPLHVIFCRNVMIYFDRATQEELIEKLARRLVPGGYLVVGHSERLERIAHGLQPVLSSIYRRPLDG